jgi:hypothetical protein
LEQITIAKKKKKVLGMNLWFLYFCRKYKKSNISSSSASVATSATTSAIISSESGSNGRDQITKEKTTPSLQQKELSGKVIATRRGSIGETKESPQPTSVTTSPSLTSKGSTGTTRENADAMGGRRGSVGTGVKRTATGSIKK